MRFGLIQVHPVPFISYKKSRKISLYLFLYNIILQLPAMENIN